MTHLLIHHILSDGSNSILKTLHPRFRPSSGHVDIHRVLPDGSNVLPDGSNILSDVVGFHLSPRSGL
jgi:hypothetical protein